MQKHARDVHFFLYSQAFADGLRTSFAILLPALLGSYFGFFEAGLSISLGAMCVSLTDAPGPLVHKVNGMLFCAGFAFVMAALTAFARVNVYAMSLEIAVATFLFSMFSVYGNRATSVGNAAILVMILTMDKPIPRDQALIHALLILGGGLFYLSISFLLYRLRPYRHAQRVLADSMREIAAYLSIRADFYNTGTHLDSNYRKLLAQQILVNEKQDAVRELFFKTRQIVKESSHEGRKLVFTFVETVDLFEDITASYYDYELLRERFAHTGALDIIHHALKKVVDELDRIALTIQTNSSFTRGYDYDEEIKQLKAGIDAAVVNEVSHKLILRKIVVNIRNLLADLHNIQQYFDPGAKRKKSNVDHSHFISHQPLDPRIIVNNFALSSSVFRHAIRVTVACSIGYILVRMIGYGQHGYWILLTIAFILKPAFSLTKQRNIERITGTVGGGAIGILILLFIPDKTAQFVLMVLFMIGAYSFMRINYLVMVMCMTPYVLILFSLFGYGFRDVAQERVIDTLIGCAIAFAASYVLFPKWESEQLKDHMRGILKANAAYLKKIIEVLGGHKLSMLEYKLVRKEVYLNSANLSAAFQRMLSEPKSKHRPESQVHQFVVLNHILFSNIATIATALLAADARFYPPELNQLARKAFSKLEESSRKLGDEAQPELPEPQKTEEPVAETKDDVLMKEQLNFIYTVSTDINRIAGTIRD